MSKASRSNQSAQGKTLRGGGHRRVLVGLHLHADAVVLDHRQQVVDHVEAAGPLGIVGAADVHQLMEAAVGIVAQVGQHLARCARARPAGSARHIPP